MIKAVLFDLDGTLINSLYDLGDAVNHCLEKMKLPLHTYEEYKGFIGDGNLKLMERSLPESLRSSESIEQLRSAFFERYTAHCADKTECYEGIRQLLCALKQSDISLAVVTNKSQELTDAVLSKLLPNTFVLALGRSESIALKPNPQGALYVMDKLSLLKNECLFVGDTAVDIKTAKAAAICSVGVTWGFRSKEELKNCGADYIINEPRELLKIIEDLK